MRMSRLPHPGKVSSTTKPSSRAIATQGLRSAEWSQPQPRSTGYPVAVVTVWARPPSRLRASSTSVLTPRCRSRWAAERPAAPAPTTATSTSVTGSLIRAGLAGNAREVQCRGRLPVVRGRAGWEARPTGPTTGDHSDGRRLDRAAPCLARLLRLHGDGGGDPDRRHVRCSVDRRWVSDPRPLAGDPRVPDADHGPPGDDPAGLRPDAGAGSRGPEPAHAHRRGGNSGPRLFRRGGGAPAAAQDRCRRPRLVRRGA